MLQRCHYTLLASVPAQALKATSATLLTSFRFSGCVRAELLQSCPTLCGPTDRGPPGSSVHEDSPGRTRGRAACPPPDSGVKLPEPSSLLPCSFASFLSSLLPRFLLRLLSLSLCDSVCRLLAAKSLSLLNLSSFSLVMIL